MKWLAKAFFKPLLHALLEMAVGELKDFAIETAKQLELEHLTSEEKRKVFLRRLEEEAKKRGKKLSEQAKNLALELAVQIVASKLK